MVILAVLRRSVQRVCGAHFRAIAPKQHKSFRKNFKAVASRWQCRRYGEGGVPILTSACAPLFWFTQNAVLEASRTARQQAMMGKGMITFKQNYPMMFS